MDQALQTHEQHAQLHKFQKYDFKIEYKAGRNNIVANALSKSFYMAWSKPHSQLVEEIKSAQM